MKYPQIVKFKKIYDSSYFIMMIFTPNVFWDIFLAFQYLNQAKFIEE